MVAVLVTGMSGVGKSSVVHELLERGLRAVDLDSDDWSHLVVDDSSYAPATAEEPMDWRWRDEPVQALLEGERRDILIVAGTSTNQPRFYGLLDHIVLLSVPEDVAVDRLARRTTNDYGKAAAELQRELELRDVVEPLLRSSACLEIDTSRHSRATVAGMVVSHAASGTSCLARRGARVRDQD